MGHRGRQGTVSRKTAGIACRREHQRVQNGRTWTWGDLPASVQGWWDGCRLQWVKEAVTFS